MSNQNIAINAPVSYRYSRCTVRTGHVVEINEQARRARCRWTRNVTTFSTGEVVEKDINIRTWVGFDRLNINASAK